MHINYNLVYPPKKNMKNVIPINKKLYKQRIRVEHSMQKLKLFKRIQLRYDSSILSYSSFVFLALSIMIHRYS
jgi:transposase